MPWYVLYTKPKNEKKVAEGLQKMGITVFCPLKTVIKQWSDRKKKVQEPLFRSYVFVSLTPQDRQLVFEVPGVVRYLFWLGKPALVRDSEITTLQQWLSSDYTALDVQSFTPGTTIAVPEGVFMGQSAVVQEQRGKKLRLFMEAIGAVITIELAPQG